MFALDQNWKNELEKNGFFLQKSFFDSKQLDQLNTKIRNIIKLEKYFNLLGLGNVSERNGTIMTGNLFYKNKMFIDLILNKAFLSIPEQILGEFNLSECKIITSHRFDNFKHWWHRDYPYSFESNEKR